MNIKRIFPPLLILSFLIFESTQTSSATVPDQGPSVTGAGEFFNSGPNRPGLYEFSLDASANQNGRAHGRAVFDNLTAQTHIEIKIDCMRVGSSEADMRGTILHSTDPQLPKGTDVVFAVVDGNLVSPFFPDIITLVFPNFFPEKGCENFPVPLTMFNLDRDSIQIQP